MSKELNYSSTAYSEEEDEWGGDGLEEICSESCCGTSELNGVHYTSEQEFIHFVNGYMGSKTKHSPKDGLAGCQNYVFMFADNDKGQGQNLPEWIKKYGLGEVVGSSEWHKNRSSGNMIKVWLWFYNGEKCKPPTTPKPRSNVWTSGTGLKTSRTTRKPVRKL